MEDMTKEEFKTVMEMVIMIVKDSKDKEDAIQKLEGLEIMKQKKNSTD
jgi:hypothetical protein